jgi:hypothetical protein
MEQYKTETGRREDLEAIEVNPVLGYIGTKAYPVLETTQKTGTIYHTTLTADSDAQAALARDGTALTRVRLLETANAYSCASVEKRYAIQRDEVKQMAGIEKADRLGGMAAKRSVQRYLESALATQLQTVGTHQTAAHVAGAFITEAWTALEAIRRYPGKRALICGKSVFNGIMRFTEVLNNFSLAAVALGGGEGGKDIIGGHPNALKMLLAGILAVDEILVGDDAHWGVDVGSAGIGCNAVFLALPDPDEFSHKLDPVLGKLVQYLPDGKQPYIVESWYDDNLKENIYDAEVWYSIEEYNPEAAYVLTGVIA